MTDYLPTRPPITRSLHVYTFRDAVDHVLDAFSLHDVKGRSRRIARRAVLQAYDDLPTYDDWTYYRRRWRITTSPVQQTGTIAYTHSTRQVALSGATWPADVVWWRLRIGNVAYTISTRVSDTVITLSADSNPGANVDAGTAYTLHRGAYPLPINFLRGSRLQPVNGAAWPVYIPPTQALETEVYHAGPADPCYYTIRTADPIYSGLAIEFFPPPQQATTYDALFTAWPRPLGQFGKDLEYSTGTVSISGTTVTGTGTAWTERMVGCVIRFGTSDARPPSGLIGFDEEDEPYAEQRIITAVASATSLTIDSELDSAASYAGKTYAIGDPVDVEPHAMWTALCHLAEAHYARLSQRKEDNAERRMALALLKVKEAKAADARNHDAGAALVWPWLTWRWPAEGES